MNKNKQLMEDIYKIGIEYNDAITIEQLEEAYEKKRGVKLKKTDIVYVLNVLENARFCYIKNENNVITTKMRSQETIKKLIKLSDVDFLIYTKVENSHTDGIWTADLRKQTKLLIHQVQKGLKLLCEYKLIKQVNNIHVKNRKMYILYDLEASEKVIGGSFYKNGEFDKHIVSFIRDNICFYLNNSNYSSVASVIKYVKQADERMNYYSDSDIKHVIDTLLYEDRIKIYKNNFNEDFIYLYNSFDDDDNNYDNTYYYNNNSSNNTINSNSTDIKSSTLTTTNIHIEKNSNKQNGNTGLFQHLPTIPCLSCNIFNKCNSDINTPLNPSNCIYLSKYLELEF